MGLICILGSVSVTCVLLPTVINSVNPISDRLLFCLFHPSYNLYLYWRFIALLSGEFIVLKVNARKKEMIEFKREGKYLWFYRFVCHLHFSKVKFCVFLENIITKLKWACWCCCLNCNRRDLLWYICAPQYYTSDAHDRDPKSWSEFYSWKQNLKMILNFQGSKIWFGFSTYLLCSELSRS